MINGTNDVVHGSNDKMINGASSDTVRCAGSCGPRAAAPWSDRPRHACGLQMVGDQNTMDSDANGNEIHGSYDAVNYHASNNTARSLRDG